MTVDPRLERYLGVLEQALRPFAVSDRAEIITEIKSHVFSAMERDPQTRLDTVLDALGEPETVANRYLIERGLKPTKPPISPVVKWMVIGFLCTFAMILLFTGILVARFSPLVELDEKEERVSLLGGMFTAKGSLSSDLFSFGDQRTIEGEHALATGGLVQIDFGNGKIDLQTSDDGSVHWDCQTNQKSKGKEEIRLPKGKEPLVLNFAALPGVSCDLSVPRGARIQMVGANGKIDFDEPEFSATAKLTNGKVDFKPHDGSHYQYAVGVQTGTSENFISSNHANAYKIEISVTNGAIHHAD